MRTLTTLAFLFAPAAAFAIDADGDGYHAQNGDCDDNDPTVHPGATETCDSRDEDCDGLVDEGCGGTTTADADGDGFTTDDCDDADPEVHPGAIETCDGRDEDCDGLVDEGCGGTTTTPDSGLPTDDLDGDGFTTDDCDDANPTVHPGADDLCDDGLDQDCDGMDAHCGGTTTDDSGLDGDDDDDGDLGGIGCMGTGRSYAVVAALPLLLLGRRRRSR